MTNSSLKIFCQVKTNLANLEKQIYAFEGNYLDDTHRNGNISYGYEAYRGEDDEDTDQKRRPRKFRESDRLFSKSSVSGKTALENAETKAGSGSLEDYDDKPKIKAKPSNTERKTLKPRA